MTAFGGVSAQRGHSTQWDISFPVTTLKNTHHQKAYPVPPLS